jgi:sterol desaturase/sphingolipid hydroxylase (fatty acid hydroxylase superfamily)
MTALLSYFFASFFSLAIAIVCILACRYFERRSVIEFRPSQQQLNLNVICTALIIFFSPLSAVFCIYTINSWGYGVFDLRATTGWQRAASTALFIVTMDLGEYLFHRTQHRWGPLWAMHSLHHSDEALNATTTGRHFCIEPTLKALTIYAAVGLVLKVDTGMFIVYNILSYYNYFLHANVNLSYGKYSWMLNSPNYHRLHHARSARFHDKNFAALFPIFDVMAGSYCAPGGDEFPPTGIEPRDQPRGVGELLVWPIRAAFRRAAARAQSRA